jgi:dTMP kinase
MALIVIEGIERAGKTTQCHLLASALHEREIPATVISFPDRDTPIGRVLHDYLRGGNDLPPQATHFLFAANRWEHAERIRALVARGTVVILDRYVISGLAYTAAHGVSPHWCCLADAGLPMPTVTFYLRLNADDASQRADFGGEVNDSVEYLKRVASVFDHVCPSTSGIMASHGEIHTLNAMAPIARIHDTIVAQTLLHVRR